MTRFAQLPVGQRFELDGEIYFKESPLIARAERTGTSRMIPRSANVHPADNAVEAARRGTIDTETIHAALEAYHSRLATLIAPLLEHLKEEERDRFRLDLAEARGKLMKQLES